MTCDDVRRHWNLYYDSEGESEMHLQINAHLELCPECAGWVRRQCRFEDALREALTGDPPTAQLWDSVLAGVGLTQAAPARHRAVLYATSAVGMCLALVLLLWLVVRPGRTNLAGSAAGLHEQLVEGTAKVQHRSSSDLEIEAYLRRRVPFPVRCPPRVDAGFDVRGAGVCTLGGQKAAYLLGRIGPAPVSIFILAADSLEQFPHQREALRRERTHHCHEGKYQLVLGAIDRNIVLVIGETESEPLLKVLRAYGSYPGHNHSA